MRVLALEPYYGGSHRAFLDGWSAHSRHQWEVLGLPAYKWKWRMRHAAITMAEQISARIAEGAAWDVILCSDMLNLAELRGLAPTSVSELPAIAYFHENQLTYPRALDDPRDYHFAFTNLTTGFAARQVWFNSHYHRDAFLGAIEQLLARMPDHQPLSAMVQLRGKSIVQPPGVTLSEPPATRTPGPLRILWAARWEHDKDPEAFFEAIDLLRARNVPFRLSVLGESFESVPDVFESARQRLADHIDLWGYQQSKADYVAALKQADIVVSTAQHEFFGIAVVEAVSASAAPLIPNRLSYPEVFQVTNMPEDRRLDHGYFHSGQPQDIADRLCLWADVLAREGNLLADAKQARQAVERFGWDTRAPELDEALASAAQ